MDILGHDIVLELDAWVNEIVDQCDEIVLLWVSINLDLGCSSGVILEELVVEGEIGKLLLLLGV